MAQHLPDFAEPKWFVCHTKPRCEKKFADLMAREQLEHYLPLIQSVRRYNGQKKIFTKPLFAGYVFTKIEPAKTRIYQQDLLVRALPIENEALFLRQIEDVRIICSSGLEAAVHPLMRKGTHVRVVGGPLHGLEGYVDDPVNPRGIVVSVDVLQQGLLVRLPLDSLQLLPDPLMLRRLLLVLLISGGPLTYAQTVAPSSAEPDPRPTFYWRIQGLFDFELPNIDPPGTMKLIVHPHFGDLIRRDYMRVDTGFRWAINERFEISPEGAVYFNHGMGDNNDSGYGVGELRLGSKYVIPHWPNPNMETSLTLAVEVPVKDAPIDMTDGLNHITPAFLTQYRLQRWNKWTTFGGAGLDLVSVSDVAGTPVRNQPRDDSMNFTVGAIYDLGQVKWTLSTTYATTNFIGDESEDFFYVRPNVLWYVPKKYTFNSKTQWILGLGARLSWGPDGTEVSTSTRVRAEITFRQVMQKIRTLKPSERNKP